MLVVEQLSSSHAHQHHPARRLGHHLGITSPDSVFDVELAGFEDEPSGVSRSHTRRTSGSTSVTKTNVESDAPLSAYPITIGLVMHGLADGLALGMSVLSSDNESSPSYGLSLVVFMALAVHKGTFCQGLSSSLASLTIAVPCLCSSYCPRVHGISDVNLSLADGVQKTSAAVQCIDPNWGYCLLRILLSFRNAGGGRRWHCPAHICEFLCEGVAPSTSNKSNSRPEVFSTWQLCCSQSPVMIHPHPRE